VWYSRCSDGLLRPGLARLTIFGLAPTLVSVNQFQRESRGPGHYWRYRSVFRKPAKHSSTELFRRGLCRSRVQRVRYKPKGISWIGAR
jgi:hypothetical protein